MCYNLYRRGEELKSLRGSEKEQKVVTRSYEVEDSVLKLIMGLEVLAEQRRLPLEYRKVAYECLSKLEDMAGLREKKYLEYDIVDYRHQVNIDFKKMEGR